MTDETKQPLYPRESLSPKDYLAETCPRCNGSGYPRLLDMGCRDCGGTGRAVRHKFDPASGVTGPTDEDLRVAGLEEQLQVARDRARTAERERDANRDAKAHFQELWLERGKLLEEAADALKATEAAGEDIRKKNVALLAELKLLRHQTPADWQRFKDERDALKQTLKEVREGLALWSCPDCAFTYDARHHLADGTHSCPNCGEDKAESERDALKARVEALEGLLRDNLAGGGDGLHVYRGDRGCGCLWHAAAREALAVRP